MNKNKKVYFVVEAYVDGEISDVSECISGIINPITNKEDYAKVFTLDTALKADDYEPLDYFMAEMVRISSGTFDYFDELMITAIRIDDDVFSWGWDIKFDGEECTDIQTLDWLKDGKIFKYCD